MNHYKVVTDHRKTTVAKKAIHNTLNILLYVIKSWLLGKMKTLGKTVSILWKH